MPEELRKAVRLGLTNHLRTVNVDRLVSVVKNRLKRMRYRPDLIDGFLARLASRWRLEPPWQTLAVRPIITSRREPPVP